MQDEISVQVIFEFSRANLRNSKFDQRVVMDQEPPGAITGTWGPVVA